MKIMLILSCVVAFLSGCATVSTDYYTSPNQAGYTQPNWGGLCENCNRMFTFSSAQLYGNEQKKNLGYIDPIDWGLKNNMTQQEVIGILGKPIQTENGVPYIAKRPAYLEGETWYWSEGRRAVFIKTTRSESFKLYCCLLIEYTVSQPIENITCHYCGKVQDIKMAANRWTYARQQAQANADAQYKANMQGALLGMAVGMQQAQQQQMMTSQQACIQNTNSVFHNAGQRGAYFQPVAYQQPAIPVIPKIQSPNVPTTTTGKIVRVAPDEHIYAGDDGSSGRLMQVRDDEYIYQETR